MEAKREVSLDADIANDPYSKEEDYGLLILMMRRAVRGSIHSGRRTSNVLNSMLDRCLSQCTW
jgi:hypothetical protein